MIDFTGLLAARDRSIHTDVRNGIAHDAANDRPFATAKRWPKLLKVRLKLKGGRHPVRRWSAAFHGQL
ncbi:glutaminyl-peptide cyclotransferase [Desulfosarcina sp.]|uniref:glutaminyl-peptide cyclotransferase n=1 Tax=Desulfosarcina sp. TaxID=2027861 RepID=UPI003970B5D7